jgi:hypothetical protein
VTMTSVESCHCNYTSRDCSAADHDLVSRLCRACLKRLWAHVVIKQQTPQSTSPKQHTIVRFLMQSAAGLTIYKTKGTLDIIACIA